ncbi:hypothetical protein GCM10027072_29380 [Streptomyces bullii]
MSISLRAAALRTALERALGEPVHLLATRRGTRMYADAPDRCDPAWPRVLEALRSADVWGSTDANGAPEIWAQVDEG